MSNLDTISREKFFYPLSSYHGEFTPENLLFNANLQEFAQKVSFISSFHTAGKISSQEAYKQLIDLWEKLEESRKTMGIDTDNKTTF